MTRWLRYAGFALAVTIALVGVGWPFLPDEGRRGFLLAGAVALPLQLVLFGALASRRIGSPGFLAAWAGSTFVRLLAVFGVALWAARSNDVDTLSAMLALAGLLFVLLLLEPWALREGTRTTDSNETTEA